MKIQQEETGRNCSPAHVENANGPLKKSHFMLKYDYTSLTCLGQPTPACKIFGLDMVIDAVIPVWRYCEYETNSSEWINKTMFYFILTPGHQSEFTFVHPACLFLVGGSWQEWFMVSLPVAQEFGKAKCPITKHVTRSVTQFRIVVENSQNLSKQNDSRFCWNPRFDTGQCSIRTLSLF